MISSCAKTLRLLRSVFDRKTAIERDHAATASDQTKFKVAEGRSKVAIRRDWGITKISLLLTRTMSLYCSRK